MVSDLVHFYRTPGIESNAKDALLQKLKEAIPSVASVDAEICFNVDAGKDKNLTETERETLLWLLRETFEPEKTADTTFLAGGDNSRLVEVGPRLCFTTAWSSNAVSICEACGLSRISRIERSRRYAISTAPGSAPLTDAEVETCAALLHDRMTECVYGAEGLTSLSQEGAVPKPVKTVDVLGRGRVALEEANAAQGLGFDEWDLDYYLDLFVTKLKRNPTDVEVFDMGQSNSEHSRHWFFGGRLVIDGVPKKETLFQMVKATLPKGKANNSVIAFHDNSSAIKGFPVQTVAPTSCTESSSFELRDLTLHPILTAETHNFPSGVAPFPGAETGTGGRIRDVQATGRGANVVAGVSAYCVGNLQLPDYPLPWEDESYRYPSNLARPLAIEIEASNGASDYGNKFGEPVVTGFTRSFGLTLPNGERREWVKPIMFSAGIGSLDSRHVTKGAPEKGMWVVKIGGPAYRIGMGGGAASSRVQDVGMASLDFDAVQRGDAEMENKMNRVIRACVELQERNPIVSIHDQGAGGNGNVLKEICEPLGAKLDVRKVWVGDASLSILEIWGAEFQENNALLLRQEHAQLFLDICKRENATASLLGQVSDDGQVVLFDSAAPPSTPPAVDLPLSLVLADMPQKTFTDTTQASVHKPLQLPAATAAAGGGGVGEALDRVLRLMSVGSKRFLTTKVDRSVTGLVAQQQCVGPLHLPLADVAVLALTHRGTQGTATAVGEQPIKGLVCTAAMARLTMAEALTNLVWAPVTALEDVKCSANWMWAAKLEGEGAAMYEACQALRDAMLVLGVGVDGGKDSLSMAARVEGETVKAPGALVVTVYAACPDITRVVTPDIKRGGGSVLLLVEARSPSAPQRARNGGSALAQVYGQVGDEVPDLDDPAALARAFNTTQQLLLLHDTTRRSSMGGGGARRVVLSGHDRSDGGLITAALEMGFAGNCGMKLDVPFTAAAAAAAAAPSAVDVLFAEEVGLLLEVALEDEEEVLAAYAAADVSCVRVGETCMGPEVEIAVNGERVLEGDIRTLRDVWEATSFQLELQQTSAECVKAEREGLFARHQPAWRLTYSPQPSPAALLRAPASSKPRVAIIRQEGSNGDREMASAFFAAGMDAWDVAMSDVLLGRVTLDAFHGIAFVGGFSYADVMDSAKGWAATIRFNKTLMDQFQAFRDRPDTFSLGVCNGCQLMALLGFVPGDLDDAAGAPRPLPSSTTPVPYSQWAQPRFVHNSSGRFESRFSSVTVLPSPAVMLKGMEGSTMGVWVAHGEGRAHFPCAKVRERVLTGGLAPIRYADDSGAVTTRYPFCPNGSDMSVAALCSPDGRHLAMMPHPERVHLGWQMPWQPDAWSSSLPPDAGPWLRMFQNAHDFCVSQKRS